MKKTLVLFLIFLILGSSAYSETKDPFFDQSFKRTEIGNISFLIPDTWERNKTNTTDFIFESKSLRNTDYGVITITLSDVSPYGDPALPNLLDTIYPTLAAEIKASGKVSDFTIYFAEYNNAPIYFAKYYLTIGYQKHPTAVVLYILDGNLISFTLSNKYIDLDTVLNRTLSMFKSMRSKEVTPTSSIASHIYDEATISQNMSIVYANSSECTDETLTDWYFNHIIANDYYWGMILYTDKNDNSGVYATNRIVEKDVIFRRWEDGSYSKGDNSSATILIPSDGKLIHIN